MISANPDDDYMSPAEMRLADALAESLAEIVRLRAEVVRVASIVEEAAAGTGPLWHPDDEGQPADCRDVLDRLPGAVATACGVDMVAAERERCAKVCISIADTCGDKTTARLCAATIRGATDGADNAG